MKMCFYHAIYLEISTSSFALSIFISIQSDAKSAVDSLGGGVGVGGVGDRGGGVGDCGGGVGERGSCVGDRGTITLELGQPIVTSLGETA
jgi:hypothetical protein